MSASARYCEDENEECREAHAGRAATTVPERSLPCGGRLLLRLLRLGRLEFDLVAVVDVLVAVVQDEITDDAENHDRGGRDQGGARHAAPPAARGDEHSPEGKGAARRVRRLALG